MSSNVSPTREITADDLVDGLDLVNKNYRADASFLNKLNKLVFFFGMSFNCQLWNGTKTITHTLSTLMPSSFMFFANKSNTRPTTSNMKHYSSDGPQFAPVGKKYSEDGIGDERLFKNIFQTTTGLNFTFTNESQQCFSVEGETWQTFYIKLW